MAENDPAVTLEEDGLSVKFYQSLKASAVSNANFKIFTNTATPVEVAGALRTIDMTEDYNSISRVVRLYFAAPLTAGTNYFLRVSGLITTSGASVPAIDYAFTTTGEAPEFSELVPPPEPVFVEDHSIIEVFDADDIVEGNGANIGFYIEGQDPEDPFVEPESNSGRVTIKFSARPAGNYVTPAYFKAQRKLISRAMNRWENVTTQVSLDGDRPWVYVSFPSLDATPVYGTAGREYFADGYKYRIKISKDVGT